MLGLLAGRVGAVVRAYLALILFNLLLEELVSEHLVILLHLVLDKFSQNPHFFVLVQMKVEPVLLSSFDLKVVVV